MLSQKTSLTSDCDYLALCTRLPVTYRHLVTYYHIDCICWSHGNYRAGLHPTKHMVVPRKTLLCVRLMASEISAWSFWDMSHLWIAQVGWVLVLWLSREKLNMSMTSYRTCIDLIAERECSEWQWRSTTLLFDTISKWNVHEIWSSLQTIRYAQALNVLLQLWFCLYHWDSIIHRSNSAAL